MQVVGLIQDCTSLLWSQSTVFSHLLTQNINIFNAIHQQKHLSWMKRSFWSETNTDHLLSHKIGARNTHTSTHTYFNNPAGEQPQPIRQLRYCMLLVGVGRNINGSAVSPLVWLTGRWRGGGCTGRGRAQVVGRRATKHPIILFLLLFRSYLSRRSSSLAGNVHLSSLLPKLRNAPEKIWSQIWLVIKAVGTGECTATLRWNTLCKFDSSASRITRLQLHLCRRRSKFAQVWFQC